VSTIGPWSARDDFPLIRWVLAHQGWDHPAIMSRCFQMASQVCRANILGPNLWPMVVCYIRDTPQIF
jgi:hypothetical protein